MQIVIEIPEETYNEVCWRGLHLCPRDGANLVKAIKNDIPLPKGHGRLIDADELYEKSRLYHTEEDGTACVEWREINDTPTIIEGSENKWKL